MLITHLDLTKSYYARSHPERTIEETYSEVVA